MNFRKHKKLFSLILIFLHLNLVLGEKEENVRPMYDVVEMIGEITDNLLVRQRAEQFDLDSNNHVNFQKLRSAIINSILSASNYSSNSSCERDLEYVARNINFKDPMNSWALQMLDAFGKPESSFLTGNLKWLGDFDECRNVYAPRLNDSVVGDFHGKYCTLGITALVFPITLGICVPETCNPSDFLHNKLNITGLDSVVTVNSLICKENTKNLTGGAIATISLMSIFGFLALMGSSITAAKYLMSSNSNRDVVKQEDESTGNIQKDDTASHKDDEPLIITEGSPTKLKVIVDECQNVLNCFCLFTNGSKLLNVDSTEGQLLCIHGIRFLSMSWVILCHVYMSIFLLIRATTNVVDKVDNFPFQAILNGFYSVDSFFLLSGFLLSYLYFQEAAKKKGKTPWLYFYVHRYLRLTPVYMIVLAFFTTVHPYLSSGPFWHDFTVEPTCQKSWWWNLLYINNFQKQGEQCMAWSWYLANDMQFFIVSPLFLISLWRWPKIGYFLLGLFLCGNWITCFVLTYHFNLVTGSFSNIVHDGLDPAFSQKISEYFNKIYLKPYTRDAPYLVGIALGYILFKWKITNFRINRAYLWLGWLLAVPSGLASVYGLYHNYPDVWGTSFYNALSRTAFSLSLGWVIFTCITGYASAVDKILSFKLFIPLSRLTYCAYLIHLIVVDVYFSSMRTTLVFSHSTMVTVFLGLLLISYALSFLVSLLFESPIIRLEKHIRSKFTS